MGEEGQGQVSGKLRGDVKQAAGYECGLEVRKEVEPTEVNVFSRQA